jgi:hypothetical protein
LDDFKDSKNHEETLMPLNTLSLQFGDFIFHYHRQWTGRGKNFVRALYRFDRKLAQQYFAALNQYYLYQNKEPFINLVDKFYAPLGSQLHHGFKM